MMSEKNIYAFAKKIGRFSVISLALIGLCIATGFSIIHELHIEQQDDELHCDVCVAEIIIASAISTDNACIADLCSFVSDTLGELPESVTTSTQKHSHPSRGPPSA